MSEGVSDGQCDDSQCFRRAVRVGEFDHSDDENESLERFLRPINPDPVTDFVKSLKKNKPILQKR